MLIRLCAALIALLLPTLSRAQDPNYTYSLPNTIVGAGGCFEIPVLLDSSSGVPLRGWQLAICHEPGRVAALAVSRGESFESALFLGPPWFEEVTFGTQGWNAGAVLDQNGFVTLPPGPSHELYRVNYGALSGGPATSLDFCSLATTGPAISPLLTTFDQVTITPTVNSGFVTITTAPGGCNDECDDAVSVGDGTTPYHLGAAGPDGPLLSFACGVEADRDVWFCYTASCNGFGKVELDGNGFVAVYDGCVCPATNAALLACDIVGPGLGETTVTFPVLVGQQYLIQVGTSTTAPLSSTTGNLTISCEAPECVLPNNGSGTVDLPPVGCTYASSGSFTVEANGMPAALLNLEPTLGSFSSVVGPVVGGTLAGDRVTFDAQLDLDIVGFGAFAGYQRTVTLAAANTVVDLAPRPAGLSVQGFTTELQGLFVELAGDSDFSLLRITAGTNLGFASPGFTTARLQPSGSYAVDSFFDVSYQIDFSGAATGPFAGRSGTTFAVVRIQLGNGVSAIPRFVRGDANLDQALNVGDTISVLAQLFSGAPQLCRDASDANDDGSLNLADAVFGLTFLFQGGALPPEPTLVCGPDPTPDALDCADDSACP